jgi:hypothetical protein
MLLVAHVVIAGAMTIPTHPRVAPIDDLSSGSSKGAE